MQNTTAPRLLMCSDINHKGDHIDRYLFPNNKVKHITVKANAYTRYHHDSLPLPIPEGDWNCVTADRDPNTGNAYFRDFITKPLQGVTSTWHAGRFDHEKLALYVDQNDGRQNNSKIYMPTQRLSGRLIVVKIAQHEDDIPKIAIECEIYERIQNKDIAPEFLGYVTEQDRIIGFAIERIDGAREATEDDVDECDAVLKRLHHLGIAHGDTHGLNFLIKDDRAWLIDFETSSSTSWPGASEQDFDSLRFKTQSWR
jgi:predicted Ser/Thr protein kinase